jgi:cytochrome d ubiquinol oxidase subunit II
VRPQSTVNYLHHPVGFIFPVAVATGLAMMIVFLVLEKDASSFACSTLYLAAMLLGAAFALYPVLMPSTLKPAYDITISTAMAGHYGLSFGLIWWGSGMALAAAYFVFMYWMFRGRVPTSPRHGEHV